MKRRATGLLTSAMFVLAVFSPLAGWAQTRAPQQQWWAYKTQGAVYTAPNRPLWKLADLKQMHAGQANWQELVISSPEQQATYNSAAPGTKFVSRMNTDTKTLFIVVAGEMHFTVEGQPPLTATRGSLVNILDSTIHSWDIAGGENALWVEVHPTGTKTVYPAAGAPPPPQAGAQIVKIAFNHTPGVYTAPNQLHWNFRAAVAACAPMGVQVNEDHQFASALAGFAQANDPEDTCKGRGGPPTSPPSATPFNPNAVFGHMHDGKLEWWVVQAGHIGGKFEKVGQFVAGEGDILTVPPSTWHQLSFEGPGLSERLAITPFPFNNMNNTASGGD